MSLEWRILINDEYKYNKDRGVPDGIHVNEMYLERYNSPIYYVGECGINPYNPITKGYAENYRNIRRGPDTLNAEQMISVAKKLAKKATDASHIRAAAWLWTWANEDADGHRITLQLSY